jgi:hypothetical protein
MPMSNLLIVAAAELMFAVVPVAVRSDGTQKACRQEAIRDCVKRLTTYRDPVSGHTIQRKDAVEFCIGRTHSC